MANVMVQVMPFAGHVAPVKPVVTALLRAGHRVRVHTGGRYTGAFADLGAGPVPWRSARDFDERDLPASFPALSGRRGLLGTVANVREVFVGTAAGQARDLREAWAREPWDVLLADTACFGAPLVSALTPAPWASLHLLPLTLPSRDLPPPGLGLAPGRGPLGRRRDAALRRVARAAGHAALDGAWRRARAEAGVPGRGRESDVATFSPWLVLAATVPELEPRRSDLPRHVHLVGRPRPPAPPGASRPSWWSELAHAGRPVVHVTQGTLDVDPRVLVRPALEGLADEDVLVVVATGVPGVLEVDGPVPPNARVTDLLPHDELLPETSAMVTNGGWGGVTAALAHGVPLVVAGRDLDKPEAAMRVAGSGAGIDLRTARPTPQAVRAAVRRVLGDPAYADAARRVARGFAAHDAPAEVAALVGELAARRAPLPRARRDPWGPASLARSLAG